MRNISLFFNENDFLKNSIIDSNNKTTKLQQNKLNFIDKNEFIELKKNYIRNKKLLRNLYYI